MHRKIPSAQGRRNKQKQVTQHAVQRASLQFFHAPLRRANSVQKHCAKKKKKKKDTRDTIRSTTHRRREKKKRKKEKRWVGQAEGRAEKDATQTSTTCGARDKICLTRHGDVVRDTRSPRQRTGTGVGSATRASCPLRIALESNWRAI